MGRKNDSGKGKRGGSRAHRTDDGILELDRSENFYLTRALDRIDAGDYLGALKVLRERGQYFDQTPDTYAAYGEIYKKLRLYSLCKQVWLRFLDICNEDDFLEGYYELWTIYADTQNISAEEYYNELINGGDGAAQDRPLVFESRVYEAPHLVHSTDPKDGKALLESALRDIARLEYDRAHEELLEVSPLGEREDFIMASCMDAFCLMLMGKYEESKERCKALYETYPNDLTVIGTYYTMHKLFGQSEEVKKDLGKHLVAVNLSLEEDHELCIPLANALFELGYDQEGYDRLKSAEEWLGYREEMLYPLAAAAYRLGKIDEAIEALELMTLINPSRVVADYYLQLLRKVRDNERVEYFEMPYQYILPEDKRGEILASCARMMHANDADMERVLKMVKGLDYDFRLAFDRMGDVDGELVQAAEKVIVRTRFDKIIRDLLLDRHTTREEALSIIEDLYARNEENSFGIIVNGYIYREVFIHELELHGERQEDFLRAFARAYTILDFSEADQEKILNAGEVIYESIAEAERYDLLDDRGAVSAAILREARVLPAHAELEVICRDFFEGDVSIAEQILSLIL